MSLTQSHSKVGLSGLMAACEPMYSGTKPAQPCAVLQGNIARLRDWDAIHGEARASQHSPCCLAQQLSGLQSAGNSCLASITTLPVAVGAASGRQELVHYAFAAGAPGQGSDLMLGFSQC